MGLSRNIVSTDSDINENRQYALEIMEDEGFAPHVATPEDIHWFWEDYDIKCGAEPAWEYINKNLDTLRVRYPFRCSEWFSEFYRYMPEALYYKMPFVGIVDWNLFFSLAFPLPKSLPVPFYVMINKLDVQLLREEKQRLAQEVWDDKELRKRVFKGEVLPAIYLYYITYQQLRKRVISIDKAHQKAIRADAEGDKHRNYHASQVDKCGTLLRNGWLLDGIVDGKASFSKPPNPDFEALDNFPGLTLV